MWGFTCRFLEDETLLWSCRKQPSAASVFHQTFEVFKRFKSQQRQLKSLLPATRFRVTNSGIAACLRQHRHNVVDEVDRGIALIRYASHRA